MTHHGDETQHQHEGDVQHGDAPVGGTLGTTVNVAASVMKPAPVTPDAPLLVSIATASNVSCWVNVSSTFNACATNSVAIVR